MKLVFYFGVMITMVSCSFDQQQVCYEKIADNITAKTAEKLKREKGLICVGTGGQMMGDIQVMDMGFNFYEVVSIDTARQLLIDAAQEYLSAINASEEVRPYLHDYPFTAKNVEIVIYFYNSDGHKVPSSKLNIAAAEQGKLFYYIDYPEKSALKTIHEETYEDALKIVDLKLESLSQERLP